MSETGMSLTELVIVLVLVAVLLAATATYSVPWLAREEMRGAVYTVQTHLQMARIQAVSRNREVRFLVDGDAGWVRLVDLNDPASILDDVTLAEARLPSTVAFARPDGGAPITLAALPAGVYQATFAGDGSVAEGAGEIDLVGGGRYSRVLLYGAGGVRTETWDGAAWRPGT
jgi:prepilin-type N-terminal cleavage/methylation domain-containing protein